MPVESLAARFCTEPPPNEEQADKVQMQAIIAKVFKWKIGCCSRVKVKIKPINCQFNMPQS